MDVIKSDAKKEMEKFKAQFIARQALQVALDKSNVSHTITSVSFQKLLGFYFTLAVQYTYPVLYNGVYTKTITLEAVY